MFELCCQGEPSQAAEVMGDLDRWAAPCAPDTVPTDATIRNTLQETRPWTRPTECSLWSARYSLLLHRQSKTASVKEVWVVGGLDAEAHGRRAWLVVDKQNSLSVLALAVVTMESHGSPFSIELVTPCVFDTSVRAFAELWHQLPDTEFQLTKHKLHWCLGNGRCARVAEEPICNVVVSRKMPRQPGQKQWPQCVRGGCSPRGQLPWLGTRDLGNTRNGTNLVRAVVTQACGEHLPHACSGHTCRLWAGGFQLCVRAVKGTTSR